MKPAIIPQPKSLEVHEGHFTLTSATPIAGDEGAAAFLRLRLGNLPAGDGGIDARMVDASVLAAEAYELTVDEFGITIRASDRSGFVNATHTLLQLLSADGSLPARLPCVEIADAPRFGWRGLHLDVSRHFFTVEEVERMIDLASRHKLNVFHWHLTDDPGWRIEIEKWPRLTEVGATRECTLIGHMNELPRRYDDVPHGGYYARDDVRRVVAFAAERGVTVVPEIDMPGHVQAAIAAYPELGCTGHAPEVRCHWGISREIFNVEAVTLDFARDVLDEVMELFPSRYIHVGGDEVRKHQWDESRRVQARMHELGCATLEELQSWFIRQLDDHLAANGRRLIGWDEILEGGLASNAAVMSWRGRGGGIAAASAGHPVVMAPNQSTYFDKRQGPADEEPVGIGGYIPLEKAYAFEPIPAELDEEHRRHVLGGQCQLWTEYIATADHLDYMAFPRTCALAEKVWSAPESCDFEDFRERLYVHLERLAALGVNYRSPKLGSA